jgi:outer membrane protein TolC
MNRTMLLGTIAAVALALAAPAGAQQLTDAQIHDLVKQATAHLAAAGQAGTQAPATSAPQAATPTQPTVRLTLDDAVKAALDHNLNIAVQRLNPEVQDVSIASLQSVYRPSLTSQLSTQTVNNPSTSTIGGGAAGAAIQQGLTTWNGGIAQSLPWLGGSYSLTLNNIKQTTSSNNTLFNPVYRPTWSFQLTQPLLRGRSIDGNRQSIQVTKINRDISDVQLRSTITNTLSNVREAYWNYVFAVQSVEVAQQQLNLANQLVADNQVRVQVGTMAPLDVFTAQSQAATARQNLTVAEGTMRTNQVALKQLIVAGTEDPLWNANIDPVDRPDFAPMNVDVEAAVKNALSARTDLQIAKKNLEANTVTTRYLREQLLPQADLVANYGWTGLGGTQFITQGSGLARTVVGTLPGGYGDALSTLFRNLYPQWTVTLNLSYPLGLSSAEATVARAKIQQTQNETQIKQIELQIATDVTNAATTIRSDAERVQAAQAARALAQQALDAEQAKFQVGMSTNYLVIQQQNALATAQNNELQAILNYRNAIVEFERLQQTTLQNLGVTIVSSATR